MSSAYYAADSLMRIIVECQRLRNLNPLLKAPQAVTEAVCQEATGTHYKDNRSNVLAIWRKVIAREHGLVFDEQLDVLRRTLAKLQLVADLTTVRDVIRSGWTSACDMTDRGGHEVYVKDQAAHYSLMAAILNHARNPGRVIEVLLTRVPDPVDWNSKAKISDVLEVLDELIAS